MNMEKEVKVKEHREMIVVVSALIDEKDETKIRIKTGVFVDKPYSDLAESVANTLIEIGEAIHKDVKEQVEEYERTKGGRQ